MIQECSLSLRTIHHSPNNRHTRQAASIKNVEEQVDRQKQPDRRGGGQMLTLPIFAGRKIPPIHSPIDPVEPRCVSTLWMALSCQCLQQLFAGVDSERDEVDSE